MKAGSVRLVAGPPRLRLDRRVGSDRAGQLFEPQPVQFLQGEVAEQLDAPGEDTAGFLEQGVVLVLGSREVGRVANAPVSDDRLAGPVGAPLASTL